MNQFSGMMKKAREMQARMQEVQDRLEEMTVEASSGGGKVHVVVTGKQEILEVRINPEVVDPDDVEMLEDLVLAAVKEAMARAAAIAQEELGKVTGGLGGMPGLF